MRPHPTRALSCARTRSPLTAIRILDQRRLVKETLDFIVIGAQKAGTTSLFEYLKRHPELSVPPGKEVPYFSHDEEYGSSWEAYMRKAALIDPARKWGTVTPHYMFGAVFDAADRAVRNATYDVHTVPLRIRERLPDVRLIAILRDPTERARSHHQMTFMNRLERRPFDEAIDAMLDPESLEQSRRYPEEKTSYVTRGEYGRILTGYFEIFPREQILVVFTEELERDPTSLLQRIYGFLGVAPDIVPDNLGTRYRTGATERRLAWMSPYSSLSPQGLQRAAEQNLATRNLWQALPLGNRQKIRRRYEDLAYRLDLWNQREKPGASAPSPAPSTILRLREHFANDSEVLRALVGECPPWQASS
jgi:Sulfotransferase family